MKAWAGAAAPILLSACLLSACTTASRAPETLAEPPSPPPPPPVAAIAPQAGAPQAEATPAISVTPMTVFSDLVPAENQFVNAYTRLLITSNVSAGGPGANGEAYLPYDTRDPVARLFWGKHTSLNLSANIKLSGGTAPYNATVTLLSMDHVSDSKDGEQFTRIVTHRAESFPLFLVGRDGTNSIVSVKFDLKASDTPTGSGAAIALSVAQKAISLVAPQASVLTTLSAPATQNVASALDQAVNQLFTKSVEEEHAGDRDIRAWPPHQGIGVDLTIPDESDWTGTPVHHIGAWLVSFDDPQPSIFDNIRICAPDANDPGLTGKTCYADFQSAALQVQKDVTPSAVLNYSLTNGGNSLGTVAAYVAQQSGFTAAISGFASGGIKQDGVIKLCRLIDSSMVAIGLNDLDAAIVAVAARNMAQIPPQAVTMMADTTNAAACGFAYPRN